MLYKENLEEIIFQRHNLVQSDELIVLSGYVGPNPIERLGELPIRSTVIYGMYGSDGIKVSLHNALRQLQERLPTVDIFYSNFPIHSKSYVWRNRGEVVHALVGSANFSNNGLRTPYREILAETTIDTFRPLNSYIDRILGNAQSCLEIEVLIPAVARNRPERQGDVCNMTLVDPKNGQVPDASGLNWGQNPLNHTNRDDAYIPIRADYVRDFPELFPPKQEYPTGPGGRAHRHNDSIEIIWDDGVTMQGLMEQNRNSGGVVYPKAISSFPEKRQLGQYFRSRLNVPFGQPVRRIHLDRYGRLDVGVSLINEGVYKFDFSI